MSRTISNHSASTRARHFASDNYAPICPAAWEALERANRDHATSYGDDQITARAGELIQEFLETDCEVFFTFGGTAANALALASICQSFHHIIAHDLSHVQTDECGAPEFFTGGAKVLGVEGVNGKLTADGVTERIGRRSDVHFYKSAAISLTQSTEVGTSYFVEEIAAICAVAKQHNLRVHMDGARFANAVAYLDQSPADVTWRLGVDVLSLGGTKNGVGMGEAVVFFDRDLARDFGHRRKQAGQLCSKMRFLSAPWVGILEQGSYLDLARHANMMALRLRGQLAELIPGRLLFETQANSVFVDMDAPLRDGLHARGWKFYALIGDNICRLMCAWDTQPEDVDEFVADMRELVK